jgi:hypothetical protein
MEKMEKDGNNGSQRKNGHGFPGPDDRDRVILVLSWTKN